MNFMERATLVEMVDKVEREYTKNIDPVGMNLWNHGPFTPSDPVSVTNHRKMHYAVLSDQIGRVDIITQTWSTSIFGQIASLKKKKQKKIVSIFEKDIFFSSCLQKKTHPKY